jgi:hypothetical protein
MALEGSIKEFGVADILQLIAQQQKTGVLIIESKGMAAEICFVGGQLTETRTSSKMTRSPLGEMLLRAKLISADELKRVLEKQKNTFEYLGEILLREGLVDAHNLERAIQIQIYETFYDILQWRDGSYRFDSKKVSTASSLTSMPSLESILLDVFRMIDEWPEVHQAVRSFGIVFERVAAEIPEHLDTDFQAVLVLVDGARSVSDIIDESLLGRFTTCKLLAALLKHGIIRPTAAKPGRRRPQGRLLVRTTAAVAAYLGLAAVCGALYLLPSRLPASLLPLASAERLRQSYLYSSLRQVRVAQLEKAIEMFYVLYGHYPDSLARLGQAGILDNATMQQLTDGVLSYTAAVNSYTLEPAP